MEQIFLFFSYIREFNYASVFFRIILAVIAGGLIGRERGRRGRAAGFRTHILICLGGAMTSLSSLYVATVSGFSGDIFRIPAQVISGIGFLGAGIILVKNNSTIAGLTTAAGMWVTATIGLAAGYGFYFGTVLATIICIVNGGFLSKIERNRKQATHFYVEVCDIAKIQDVVDQIETVLEKDISLETIPAKSGIVGSVGFEVTTSYKRRYEDIRKALETADGISFMVPE